MRLMSYIHGQKKIEWFRLFKDVLWLIKKAYGTYFGTYIHAYGCFSNYCTNSKLRYNQ